MTLANMNCIEDCPTLKSARKASEKNPNDAGLKERYAEVCNRSFMSCIGAAITLRDSVVIARCPESGEETSPDNVIVIRLPESGEEATRDFSQPV